MTLQSIINKSRDTISKYKNQVITGATALMLAANVNAQSGTFEQTSSKGHKVQNDVEFVEIADDTNVTPATGVVNDGPSTFNISLRVEDYFNTNKNFKVVNNPGNPTIFFNGSNPNKASIEIYAQTGQLIRTVKPQSTIDGGTLKAYIPLTDAGVNEGMYFAVIKSEFGKGTAKLIASSTAPNHGIAHLSSRVKENLQPQQYASAAKSMFRNSLADNFIVRWQESLANEIDTGEQIGILAGQKAVMVEDNDQNNLLIDNVVTYSINDDTGDVLISAKDQFGNTLQNVSVHINNDVENYERDNLIDNLGFAIENNVPVITNPTPYTFSFVHNDGLAFDAQITKDINQGQNNNLVEVVMNKPENIDLTIYVSDTETDAFDIGSTVDVIDSNDQSVLGTGTVDGDGNATVTVPEGKLINVVSRGANRYKITFDDYQLVDDPNIHQTKDTLKVSSLFKKQFADGRELTADTLMLYEPNAYHTEFLLGHMRVYFPPINGGNQVYKDHFAEVAEALGMPGAFIPSDTEFPDPTPEQYAGYDPRLSTRQVYEGLIGTNITGYSGTTSGQGTKTLPDGTQVAFFGDQWKLDGLDWSGTDHEILRMLFDLPDNTGFPTATNLDGQQNVSIAESEYDQLVLPVWTKLGKRFFDDKNYSLVKKIE
jgi:hypothetical protein